MRIAMVQPRMDVGGGAERVVAWLTHGMARRGHDVEIFTDHANEAGAHVVRPGFFAGLLDAKRLREPSIGRRLGPLLAGFDLVVIHNSPALRWIGATKDLPPVLWYCHEPSRSRYTQVTERELLEMASRAGDDNAHLRAHAATLLARASKPSSAAHRRRDRAAVGRVTRVTANSRFVASRVEQIFDRPCSVCRPGVAAPEAPPVPREDFVLAVGPTAPNKNIHNVVDAVTRLDGVRLVVAGRADSALRRGAPRRIEFIGQVDDDTLDGLYRTCALLAYVPVGEPFGLVAIEAMARGVPIVASAFGGPTETVADRETGSLANPFDVAEIAAKIGFLLGDASRRRAMGEAGRRRYEAHFTLDAFLDRFEAECLATLES